MATSSLPPIISNVIARLDGITVSKGDLLQREARMSMYLLLSELHQIQAVLKDIESWVNQIQDAASEIERRTANNAPPYPADWIDGITRKLQQISANKPQFSEPTNKTESPEAQIEATNKTHESPEADRKPPIEMESPEVENEATNGTESSEAESEPPTETESPEYSSSRPTESSVLGLNYGVEDVARMLLDPDEQRLSVISIVGMGGVGKTTVAQLVCNKVQVKEHFDCSAWICVSMDYQIMELLRHLMYFAMGLSENVTAEMTEQEMRSRLSQHLSGKRYLIVLDDVWDTGVWDSLSASLPDELNGSRVIVTTRIRDVAWHVDRDEYILNLALMSYADSWMLFCNEAFPDAECPLNFLTFKGAILEASKGLPLAIKLLAGLLGSKCTHDEWENVLQQLSSKMDFDDGTLSILNAAYDDLPEGLKPCFLSVALFPEDARINVEDLILLWRAKEMIAGGDEEGLARRYVNELSRRCLIQVLERDEFGDVMLFNVHDRLRDIAQIKAEESGFFTTRGESLDSYILRVQKVITIPDLLSRLHKFPCLVVIDLHGARLKNLPEEIGKMMHLRDLCLKNTYLTKLPASVGNLQNLQRLDIRGTRIVAISEAFWNIRSLRHVFVPVHWFRSKPSPTNDLNNLQTLEGVPSGSWIKDGLAKMENLRNLTLSDISSSEEEALGNALEKLSSLVSLTLEGDALPAKVFTLANHSHLKSINCFGSIGSRHWDQMLDSSQLLPNVSKLSFVNSNLEQGDIDMLGGLRNLQSLVLWKSYRGKELSFNAKRFPRLEELELLSLEELESLVVKKGAMPRLARFTISSCKLKKLPKGMKYLKQLQTLCVRHVLAIKERIKKPEGADYHKIKHVKSVIYIG